jgi:hypothetical protein
VEYPELRAEHEQRASQDAKFQQLLVDYQNDVQNAQQEVDNGISTFLLSRVEAGHLSQSVQAANGALSASLLQLAEPDALWKREAPHRELSADKESRP